MVSVAGRELITEQVEADVTVYIIAQLKFTDKPAYDRYRASFPGVFGKFKGTLLVADEGPLVLEGRWVSDKIVVMSFPDEEAAREFNLSAEYQEIAVDRKKGADAVVIMARSAQQTA